MQPHGHICTQWVDVYPKEAFIHRNKMPGDKSYKIDSIRIRICFDCGRIMEVVDYHE